MNKLKQTKMATYVASLIAFGSLAGGANATMVIIGGDAVTEGVGAAGEGSALGFFSNTAQVVYGSTLLSAGGLSVGDVITALSFRVNGTADSAPIWSVTDYQIRLATSLNAPGSLDTNFINNRGTDYTVVRAGALSYDGTEYSTGGEPNSFGPEIVFSSSFTYTGGDLLLEYTHSEISSGGESADASNNLPDAQTQFSAGFDTTTEGFSGFGDNFAPIVRFTTVPEPSSALLLGLGALGIAARRKRTS